MKAPDARGYTGYGSGRADVIRRPPRFRASTITAKYLYPFGLGRGLPPDGVPMGQVIGERGRAPLSCDPLTWYLVLGLISSPSAWVGGLNGFGKSAVIKRWIAVLAAFGVLPMVLSDIKGEYVGLIRALETLDPETGLWLPGQVISVGSGRGYLNLLDLGSAPAAARRLGERTAAGQQLMGDARRRRQLALEGFIGVLRGSVPNDTETDLLAEALKVLDRAFTRKRRAPLPSDLAEVFAQAPEQLKDAAMWRGDITRYHDVVTRLEQNIGSLARGSGIAEPFSKQTSQPMRTDMPTVFDLSGIYGGDPEMLAATQLACWAHGFGEIAVSHALSAAGLGSYPGDPYRTRIFMSVLDELWHAITTGKGIAGLIERLARMNRNDGLVDVKCSHKLSDDEKRVSATDQAVCARMAEFSGLQVMKPVKRSEHDALERLGWAKHELEVLTSWASPASWEPSADGVPEGVKRGMVKVGDRPAIPYEATLMPSEREQVRTDHRWHPAGVTV